jgi:hypothetical protein
MSSMAADSTPIPIARRIRVGVPSRKGFLRAPAIRWLHLPRGWPEVPGLVPVSRRDLDLDEYCRHPLKVQMTSMKVQNVINQGCRHGTVKNGGATTGGQRGFYLETALVIVQRRRFGL